MKRGTRTPSERYGKGLPKVRSTAHASGAPPLGRDGRLPPDRTYRGFRNLERCLPVVCCSPYHFFRLKYLLKLPKQFARHIHQLLQCPALRDGLRRLASICFADVIRICRALIWVRFVTCSRVWLRPHRRFVGVSPRTSDAFVPKVLWRCAAARSCCLPTSPIHCRPDATADDGRGRAVR